MGATVCTDEIHAAFVSADRTRTFFHGHSYTGNPLAAAAAVASLQVFESEPVFERIDAIAEDSPGEAGHASRASGRWRRALDWKRCCH